MHHVDTELGVPNEHVFQEQWIAHADAILRIAFDVWTTGRAFSHVEADRDVEFFSQSEIGLQ